MDDTYIIYTTEIGGVFKTIIADESVYDSAVESGELGVGPFPTPFKFIAFARPEKNYDAVLGRSR